MTTKELICQEINERIALQKDLMKIFGYSDRIEGSIDALQGLRDSFLDTLPDEEQPTKGYDEAYLNEKIAKASKSWEGVDVDKFMDEVRGREPVTDCNDLEEEIKEQIYDRFYDLNGIAVIGTSGYAEVKDMEYIARHFAEWQAKQLLKSSPLPEDTVLFQKGVEEGKRLMMEGAVEGKVFMSFAPGHNQMVMADVDLPTNTKVKIIIVKEDKK